MKHYSSGSARPLCGDKSRARWLSIELTYRCQNRCAWCYNPQDRKQIKELPEEVWTRIICEASNNGTEVVVFTGGEPLLVPFIEKLVDQASGLGLLPGLVTNGELVPEKAQSLICSGLGLVWISFLGPTELINDSITGRKGSFHFKINAFRALRNAAEDGNIVLMANVVVEPRNCHHVYAILSLLANEGVQVAYVEDVVCTRSLEANANYFLDKYEREMAFSQLKQAQENHSSLVAITRTLDRPANEHHPPLSDFINITPDGFLTETESRMPNSSLCVAKSPFSELVNCCADNFKQS